MTQRLIHGKSLGMMSFPRLSALFGVPVTSLSASVIDDAVANGIPEGADLDWKKEHYRKDKNEEFAKDVAAFANSGGGVIVLGVEEESSRASRVSPVSIGDADTRRMKQVLGERLRPYLPGIDFRVIERPDITGLGHYAIVVPRSPNAPHAVTSGNGGTILRYPVRDETITRWLTEAEVAVRYRDRYASRDELASDLDRVHREGRSHTRVESYPALAVAIVPTFSGHREVGATSVTRTLGFFNSWQRQFAPPLSCLGRSNMYPRAGARRTDLITQNGRHGGKFDPPAIELLYRGAGFGTSKVEVVRDPYLVDENVSGAKQALAQDRFEIELLGLVSMLCHHAVDTGASGEGEIRAQLLINSGRNPTERIYATEFHEPRTWDGESSDKYICVLNSDFVRDRTAAVECTISLDEATTDYRAVARAAYSLAADIYGDFAIAEPCILRPNGTLAVERSTLGGHLRASLSSWAETMNLVD